jgi:hypothetical protein
MAGLGVKEDVGPLLLEQLPCEIIICILSFLVWRDVIKCCSVSSTLRMCARDNQLWRQLYLTQFPSDRDVNSTTPISSRLVAMFEKSNLQGITSQTTTTQTIKTLPRDEEDASYNYPTGDSAIPVVGHWQRAFSIRYHCYKRWLNGQQVPDHSYTVDLKGERGEGELTTTTITSLGLILGSNTLIVGDDLGSLCKFDLPPPFSAPTTTTQTTTTITNKNNMFQPPKGRAQPQALILWFVLKIK